MENKIKISVLMAVYNTDFFLIKRAIDSVLNQTFQDFELIIIDDGSENDFQCQLLNYVRHHEHKITYLRHKNSGQSHSINRGVLNAQGKYITIIDSDDEYMPQHLNACLQEMENTDLIASTTKTIVSNVSDYYVPDKHDNSQMIHVDSCILFATLFGTQDVFKTLKFHGSYAADAQFYESASKKYRVKKVDLRTYIYYRNNPNSTCAKMKQNPIKSVA